MSDGILRCQVRVLIGDGYAACGAEATHFSIIRPAVRLPYDDYAFLMCDDHASGSNSAEAIGLKANDELRDYVRFLHAEPAF
jgi:hypothetical protein